MYTWNKERDGNRSMTQSEEARQDPNISGMETATGDRKKEDNLKRMRSRALQPVTTQPRVNTMNASELKKALITAINQEKANDFIESLVSVMDNYQYGNLRQLETAMFTLSVDIDTMKREQGKVDRWLDQYTADAAAEATEEWRMNRRTAHAIGMAA